MRLLIACFRNYWVFGLSILLVLVFLNTEAFGENQKLIIGTSYKLLLSTPSQNGMLDLIAKEAFNRIGIQIELPYLPTERSISAANDGLHDGELNRIKGLEKSYPNLASVDESMMDFKFVGFTKNISVRGGDWENIKPFQIGIIKGWKILETNVGSFPNVTYYYSAEELFTGLNLNRIDIALYGKLIGFAVMKEMNIQNVKMITPPFASKQMYMYLNKKHSGIIPKVSNALKQMKQDGTYGRIVDQSLINYKGLIDHAFK